VPGAVTAGGSVDPGAHYYAQTFVTAAGETTAAQGSAPVTTSSGAHYVPDPTAAMHGQNGTDGLSAHLDYPAGSVMTFRYAFVTAAGVTTATALSNPVTAVIDTVYGAPYVRGIVLTGSQVSADPAVTGKRIYQYRNGAFQGSYVVPPSLTQWADGQEVLEAIPPSSTNTALVPGTNYQTVPLTGILIGPANVTARRIYRSEGGSYKLVTTIANNTATTYTDTAANAALGAVLPTTNTATANRVLVSLPTAGATVTDRFLYRTAAGLGALKLVTGLGTSVTTYLDVASDASLGQAAPVTDTSGLVQPAGQVPAGSTSLIIANPAPFATSGGWAVVGNGEQVIRYSGKSAAALTGIPASGPGAILASISYNSTVTAAPALVGVTGILEAIIRNAPIHVWVQRDDLAAQAYMAALDGQGDGVYEHIWSDERRTEASLIQVCEAQLKLYSRPLVTVAYASRDLKTKSGKPVTINLTTPAIHETLTIQDVTITELGITGLAPKFTVTAGTAHTSLESVLQMLIRKADS